MAFRLKLFQQPPSPLFCPKRERDYTMTQNSALADDEPSVQTEFPNSSTLDAYLAWFQSIKLPSASRFHLFNNSLVTAKESRVSWADVQIVGEICEDSSMDYQEGF